MKPRHIERVDWSPNPTRPPDTTAWPFTIPAVKQLVIQGGLDIAPGVTFLVGENGSGKSTLVEAFAEIYPRGGHATSSARVVGPAPSSEDRARAVPAPPSGGAGVGGRLIVGRPPHGGLR